MPHKEDDLRRALQALEKDSRERLSGFFNDLQSDLAEAEEKLKEAEKKYRAARELQKGQYALVIQEVFDGPKRDLMRKISRYSLGGIVITIIVATSSFSLTASLQAESFRSLTAMLNRTRHATEESQQLLADLDFRNTAPDRGVLEIVRHFDKEKDKFNGYRPIANLARAYKIMPVDSSEFPSGLYYYQYRGAFRRLEIDDIPTVRELQRWDAEAYHLYDEWYKSVSDLGNDIIPREHKARKWDSFKSSGDGTRYSWVFSGDDATFSGISRDISRRRGLYLAQWRKNSELLP